MAKREAPEVIRQAEYVIALEDALEAAQRHIRRMEAAWARQAPCPYVVHDDEGTAHCSLAAKCAEEHT